MTVLATDQHVAAIIERIRRREYHVALEMIRTRPEARGTTLSNEERLVLDVLSGECLAFVGQYQEAIAACTYAVSVLRLGSNHWLFGNANFALAVAHYYLGHADLATEYANTALFAFKRSDDYLGTAKTLNWLGNIIFDKSEFARSQAKYEECMRVAREHELHQWEAIAQFNTAVPLFMTGRLREAKERLESSQAKVTEYSGRLNVLRHTLLTAEVAVQMRRYKDAVARLHEIREELFAHPYRREQGVWLEYMGELELSRGRFEEAARHLNEAIRIGHESGPDESLVGQSRRLLAEVQLRRGNHEEALAESERALVSIRAVGERFEEGVVHRIIGEVHAHRQRAEDAAREFRQSAEILLSVGARLEWAKTCLVAGEYGGLAERVRLGYLFEAERLFTEIGVEYWTERTRAALDDILHDNNTVAASAVVRKTGTATRPVFVTVNPNTRETLRMAEQWAQEDMAILITGETGTGKDLLARYIHWVSPRRGRPFVDIDLNTIPESLWESELFGFHQGTFTGASHEKTGLLESADGGTVFLNEIGNLSPALQAKLLEFLDTRQVRRLGETERVKLDVRLIAATNADLDAAVDAGTFRSDLFFRLEQAPLRLRPLRERREDIMPLMRHFLGEYGLDAGIINGLDGQPWVREVLNNSWEGNVRQLRNFLRRLVSLTGGCPNGELSSWALRLLDHMTTSHVQGDDNGLTHVGRGQLLRALCDHQWNQRATARELELSESAVRRLMRRWHIERPAAA